MTCLLVPIGPFLYLLVSLNPTQTKDFNWNITKVLKERKLASLSLYPYTASKKLRIESSGLVSCCSNPSFLYMWITICVREVRWFEDAVESKGVRMISLALRTKRLNQKTSAQCSLREARETESITSPYYGLIGWSKSSVEKGYFSITEAFPTSWARSCLFFY